MGGESSYSNCIFADDNLDTGLKGFSRYELAVNAGAKCSGCFFRGKLHDVTHVVTSPNNVVEAPPPGFNKEFVPEAPEYQGVGYRPISGGRVSAEQSR